MLADRIRRDSIHSACGNPVEQAFDSSVKWMVSHDDVCWACATKDMVLRQLSKEHEGDKDSPGKPRWEDGRLVSVRPATEADLRAARRGQLKTTARV